MTTDEILSEFPKLSALVVGDVCLDRWCTYDPAVSEPSRETGIPRIGVTHTEVTAGAGGTVANNLAALGVGRVVVLGAIGDDGFGHDLAAALFRGGISADMLVRVQGMQTFTYTKLINRTTGVEDLPRTDFISTAPLDPKAERQILDRLPAAVDSHDVILVSDQAETSAGGVVTPGVRELLADLALNYPDKIFWVDSRARIERFRNMVLKPNQDEAAAACDRAVGGGGYPALRRHCQANLMMVTHGPQGVLVVEPENETWVSARPIENPVDICGAGDSFSAGAAVALFVTRSPLLAARFGNLVASITIMKKGTGTASPAEVTEAGARMNTLAVDIGGTKFAVALFEGERMIRRESRPTDREGARDWMLEQVVLTARAWKSEVPFERCGIGFGGPVDFAEQRVAFSTHIGGWNDFQLTSYLSRALDVPAIMDNDANAGALGEAMYGAGRGHSPLFYMTLSTGIGGGIYSDGKIWRGADGWAGEIGHISIRPDGPECLCKARGCFERMCCGLWLERDYGKTAKELMCDPNFVARYVVDLSLGLKACIMLLNPSRIVIGGGISTAGAALFGPLCAELDRQITDWSGARVDVAPAELGHDSVLYGALALAKTL